MASTRIAKQTHMVSVVRGVVTQSCGDTKPVNITSELGYCRIPRFKDSFSPKKNLWKLPCRGEMSPFYHIILLVSSLTSRCTKKGDPKPQKILAAPFLLVLSAQGFDGLPSELTKPPVTSGISQPSIFFAIHQWFSLKNIPSTPLIPNFVG